MDTPTTEDLDKAYTAKQAALLDYRNSRGEAAPTRQQWLDRYVIAVSAYERIRAQTSDKWLAKHPEMDAANDNLEADMVNNPPHYTDGEIECIDAIRAALGPDGFRAFCRGNAMKYIWRCELKDNMNTDLEKAGWYLQTARNQAGV
ncbi:MAG: DUF3310 domain-containing protein [Candidatus Puniceispirillaceae bacterium]